MFILNFLKIGKNRVKASRCWYGRWNRICLRCPWLYRIKIAGWSHISVLAWYEKSDGHFNGRLEEKLKEEKVK